MSGKEQLRHACEHFNGHRYAKAIECAENARTQFSTQSGDTTPTAKRRKLDIPASSQSSTEEKQYNSSYCTHVIITTRIKNLKK